MKTFIAECQRHRIFRVAALYLVAAWAILQVADLAFDNWGIPSEAMRNVWIGAIIGIPIALVLGWRFNIVGARIIRTPDSDNNIEQPLRRTDYIVLTLSTVIAIAITVGLLFEIMQTQPPAPERMQLGDADPRSIAVLPFTDMSPAGDQGYLADGLAEELLNLLAQYNGLRVTSRSSSFALRDQPLSIPEVAEKLKTAHVLEGSVRKAGNRVRITAQLIEAGSDTHLWSQTYDRELDDIFAIQDQIAAQVVQELKVHLLGPAPASGATSAAAYEIYLQGLSLLARRGANDTRQSIELFEQVVAVDPDYAPAHASLALALIWSDLGTAMILPRIEAAANRALALQPGNSDAMTAVGFIRENQGHIDEAREAYRQAIANNPNNALAYRWLGRSYSNADPARYLALIKKAYLLDPLDPSIHFHLFMGAASFGRTDEALAAARQRLVHDPTDGMSYLLAGQIHRAAGHLDLALKSNYRGYLADPDGWYYGAMFWTLVDLGELELADTWLREVKRQTGWAYVEPDDAILNFLMGQPEAAVQQQVAAHQRGEIPDQELAYWIMRFSRDFALARQLYEQGFTKLGQDIPHFDPNLSWFWYTDYVLLLQRTGEPNRATGMIREIKGSIEERLSQGVVFVFPVDIQILLAVIHAASGSAQEALIALRQAVDDGETCVWCLQTFPHFDNLRGEPEFAAVITEARARNSAQRQKLADENMLLTPEEVLRLKDFSFDPFLIE